MSDRDFSDEMELDGIDVAALFVIVMCLTVMLVIGVLE
jgi:preprotein translocase subunit Sec61beta